MKNNSLKFRHQTGVSLVEALVALVVLSVGMLGIAGLYLESLRSNRTALSRTSAVMLVNDMADRIRGNRAGLAGYAMVVGTAPATGGPNCSTVLCTPAQLAAWDMAQWYAAVIATLPNGPAGTTVPRASITYTAAVGTTPARYVIFATWLDTGSTDWLSTTVEVMQLGTT